MLTIGIDLSLVATGIATVNEDGKFVLATVRSEKSDYPNDFKRIDDVVEKIMFHIPDTTEAICIERPFVRVIKGSIDAASKKIIAMTHCVHRAITYAGHNFVEVAPNQLKKFALGTGSGEKSQIMKEVYKRWGVDAADDNQADAAVLAAIAYSMHSKKGGRSVRLTKAQGAVVSALLKG